MRGIHLFCRVLCVWLTLAAPPWVAALAQSQVAPPAGATEVTAVEGVTEYRLANGLQILLVPDASKPSTTVNLTVRVGSRHENYGETGMAHLLEHLLFKGSPTTPNALAEFSKRGMQANGTTSLDRTNYFASFTANDENLRWYIGWLADALVNSFVAKEDLDSEMTVVRNEMEMGENSPGRVLIQRLLSAMYDWHAYGRSTIGARSDVENVDISRLKAFYKQHYQPDNATLIVSGRFDAARVLAWAAESFGKLPRPTRVIAPTYTLDPAQDGERQITVRRVGGTPRIYIGMHVPPGSHPDYGAISLLAQVLGDTPGGRVHKRLVDKQLAATAFGGDWANAEPGLLVVGVLLAPGQDVDKARSELAATLDAVVTEPVTAEELERARTQWINAWEKAFTDPEVIGVQLSEAIAMGDWRLFFLTRDHVRRVTLADVNRVAADWLKRDNRTFAIYQPVSKPERAPAPARVDVAALVKGYKGDPNVAQAEAFEATPANLEARTRRSTLASGLKVALLPKGTRGRAVEAQLALRLGDVASLKGESVVARMAASMITMGGAGLTRQQISDRFDKLRADVSFGFDQQTLTVSVNTVREHLPDTLRLIGQLLRQPAFPAEALEEQRRQWLASLETRRREPRDLVADALARHGNPYPRGDLRHAMTFDELEQEIKALTVPRLQAFARRFLHAEVGEFAAVGDMDADAVRAALAQGFGDWRAAAGAARYQRAPQPLVNVAPLRTMLAAPDRQNASMRAQLALPLADTHADYVAVMMANYMLGASNDSRLWMRVREKDGLSYDVRSYVQWSSHEANSLWVSSAIFAPQNQGKVEAAWREELQRSVREGFTQAELDGARVGLLNQRRLARAQDDVVTRSHVNNLHLGRTFAVSQRVDEEIAKVTLAEVNAAWRRYFDPAKLAVAWAGDFKAAP